MSFCIELFCVVTLQYQILVRIANAYFIIEKKKAAPQPWQAIAQRFCSTVKETIGVGVNEKAALNYDKNCPFVYINFDFTLVNKVASL